MDIVAANTEVLKAIGISPDRIETSGICTFLNPDEFFSARRNAGGRFASGIMIEG
ncbi:MAG: laccase domain-containing protein [Bacteroidales bacterium]|nr:laccase domain-containing protein [Bacteroidales bacterium]